MHIWMRQFCLVVRDLPAVARTLCDVLDTRVTHGSGDLSAFGARGESMNPEGRAFLERQAGVTNASLPIGNDFIELIQPTREDTAAARHLARRGGDGGYMFVLQARGIPAWRMHMQEVETRIVRGIDHDQYEAFHIHPADIGAAIVSLGSVRPINETRGPWYPAGWQPAHGHISLVDGFAGAVLECADPQRTAARWQKVLKLPAGNTPAELRFDNAVLRFVRAGERGEGVRSLLLATRQAQEIRRRAQAAGVLDADGAVRIGGVELDLVSG